MSIQPNSDTATPAISWLPGTSAQQGGFSIAAGAAIWGLYWIPLRFLDSNGIPGLWAVFMVMAVGILPSVIVLFYTKQTSQLSVVDSWLVGSALSISTVLYFTGIVFSDVIRVVFLFYLLPVWTTITARLIYKEAISAANIVVIIVALFGLSLFLGGGTSLPVPKNIGDWCGLLAGMCWGFSLSILRGKESINSVVTVLTTCVTGAAFALVAIVVLSGIDNVSASNTLNPTSWVFIGLAGLLFSVFMMYPSMMSQIWGAQRVPAPTAALLTMTEVVVSTLSAYVLIGTELNKVSVIGAFVILAAVLLDVRLKFAQANRENTAPK